MTRRDASRKRGHGGLTTTQKQTTPIEFMILEDRLSPGDVLGISSGLLLGSTVGMIPAQAATTDEAAFACESWQREGRNQVPNIAREARLASEEKLSLLNRPQGQKQHRLTERPYQTVLSAAKEASSRPRFTQLGSSWSPGSAPMMVPLVTIAAKTLEGHETGQVPAVFTVKRTGNAATNLTVSYMVGGTATNGLDYATLTGTVVIPAGSSRARIPVIPLDDAVAEGYESVELTLTPGVGYGIDDLNPAQVTIFDNDAAVSIVATSPVVYEHGTSWGQFQINRVGPPDTAVTVSFLVTTTGPIEGTDFWPIPRSVEIGVGSASRIVSIISRNNQESGHSGTISLTLNPGIGYSIEGPSTATMTFIDDEQGGFA